MMVIFIWVRLQGKVLEYGVMVEHIKDYGKVERDVDLEYLRD
jgi:hypothetical protein